MFKYMFLLTQHILKLFLFLCETPELCKTNHTKSSLHEQSYEITDVTNHSY